MSRFTHSAAARRRVCRPVSPYGVTKLAGEHFCDLFVKARGLLTVVVGFFTVFGLRQRPDMAFHKFMQAMLEGRPIDLFGDGSRTRDFTYVDDIVSGVVACARAPAGTVMNLGGGHRVSMLEALEALAGVTGLTPEVSTTMRR